MKKNKHSVSTKKKTEKIDDDRGTENSEQSAQKIDSLDEEEQGFGGWLRSHDGLETMKLFVIANSIVMLTTLLYPHVHTVFGIVYDVIYGPDSIY